MTARYDELFARFDSPLMQQVRAMAYGEDIGQHSWVTADELRADAVRLSLGSGARILDLGCGACGPLVFLAHEYHCAAFGLDASAAALASGQRRADAANVSLTLQQHDLAQTLPFDDGCFDAVISTDVVLHLSHPDRQSLFRDVRRVLRPGGRFLFTDAGVVTGFVSADEIARRSAMSTNYLAPAGHNEECLTMAGLALREREDRTVAVAKVARGRLAAYAAHRAELLQLLGDESMTRDELYLSTVADLAERRALSRFMYFAERLRE